MNFEKNTQYSELLYKQRISDLEKAKADTQRAARKQIKECKHCFYFKKGLAGQAFTWYKCELCGDEEHYPNTRVPLLCKKCAEENDCCRRCGSREY